MAEQLSFLQKLFRRQEPIPQTPITLIELELKAVLEIEQRYGDSMSTIDVVKYCKQRFGVNTNEATWVNSQRVLNGVVSKYKVREFIAWYKRQNKNAFKSKYPFQYIGIDGKVYKDGYKKTL